MSAYAVEFRPRRAGRLRPGAIGGISSSPPGSRLGGKFGGESRVLRGRQGMEIPIVPISY
jgi:hypothetical protein